MRPVVLLVFSAAMIWLALPAPADDRHDADAPRPTEAAEIDADDVLAFVREHHPELARLLGRLRSSSPEQFEKAIADIARAKNRLTRLQDQDPKRYHLALKIWSIDSRIRLLVARSMRSDENVRQQVRELLAERHRARLALLKLERDRLQSRLDHVETQITRFQDQPEQTLESDLNRVLRNRTNRPPRKPSSPNAPRNK